MAQLTQREMEIAVLLGKGLKASEIGQHLGISEQTVKRHLSNARTATGARNSTHLAVCVALLRAAKQ